MLNNTISDLNTISGGKESLLANRYRVVRPLGQGGMGSVWLAEDTALENRPVAIKMLPTILLANPRSYQQIKAEALVSLKLTHPNIATLRSFEENDGNPFLVIDYIDGVTLEVYLGEKGTLSEEETLRLLRPIASALDYAHREKVIHRDVKPGNVMVRRDGTPFVLDFGIAREMRETLTRVTGKLSSGTLLYMSPEQLMGAPPAAAQDVYGFAAMAYECLSGHPPFHRGQVEFQILNAEPPSLVPETPLARRILRGLAKDPAGRPQSCLDVLDEVAELGTAVESASAAARPVALRLSATRSTGAVAPARPIRVDADVYMLEDEAQAVYDQVISKMPEGRHSKLDESLRLVRRAHRAAGSALRRGDAEAARKLLLEVVDYPVQRRELARTLALEAFEANRLTEAFSLSGEADGDSPEIRLLRGFCRQSGQGAEIDPVVARADYLVAAEAGLAEAQYNLATMLLCGEGGDVDVAGAVTWYKKAAEQNLPDACRALGALYDEGKLVPREATRAFDYLFRAYKLGNDFLAAALGSFCAANEDHGLSASLRRQFIAAAAAADDAGAKRFLAEEARHAAKAAEDARVRQEAEARRAAECRAARIVRIRKYVLRGLWGVGFGVLLSILVWGGARGYCANREHARMAAERARAAAEARQAVERKAAEEHVELMTGKCGVQLWKDGPYWATCNVGASKPEEYGYYFWWGDTVGYKRTAGNNGWVSVKDGSSYEFDDGNCPTFRKNNSELESAGYIDSTGNLVAAHDAATAHLGAPWRMPTDAEFSALIRNCDVTWTTRGGVYGRLVTGRGAYASKSIFLPAAGYGVGSDLDYPGSHGYFWSSTPISGSSDYAWYLFFDWGSFGRYSSYRYYGQSVRPLRGFAK